MNGAQDAIDEAVPTAAADPFCQRHSLANGRVSGNRVEKGKLIRAELQEGPQFALDAVSRTCDVRRDECIERHTTTDDAVDQFDGQSAIFGMNLGHVRQAFVEQLGNEPARLLVPAEHFEGDAARGLRATIDSRTSDASLLRHHDQAPPRQRAVRSSKNRG